MAVTFSHSHDAVPCQLVWLKSEVGDVGARECTSVLR